jgi:TonB family protein
MKLVALAIILLFVPGTIFAQNLPKPDLVSAQLPRYPPLARQTRTQGEVEVEFALNPDGEPMSVAAVSGHPLLKSAAENNVKSWRFRFPKGLYRSEWKYRSIFNFKISADEDAYDEPKLTVVMDSFEYVEVITNPPSLKSAHDCPSKKQAEPPTFRSDSDFVKLSRSACLGTCPAYEVTIAADGEVTWQGSAFVHSIGTGHSRISSDEAAALLRQFRVPKFWALCGGYDASVTDNPTTQISVEIGGRTKSVWNYANSAPPWLEEFEESIDAAADTHAWRHGDARAEPLGNILGDAFLPKPGVNELMRAAARPDASALKAVLAGAQNIDAVDSSGWTALMYAAASSNSEPVQLFLKAGANPNHRSFTGDTPIMASAVARDFDEDLWRGGADVNAKNVDGVSALMILAAKGDADAVKAALNAGADPSAKDMKGRSPADYLRLANCGKSPIEEWHEFSVGAKCGSLDEDEVRQIASLLKHGKGKSKRP